MKYFIFISIFSIMLLNVKAQTQSYNVQGDIAFEKKEYQDARIYYSEGVPRCEIYSIRRLKEIWELQPQMRSSMNLIMRNSYKCLDSLAEQQDRDAMLLISDFYKMGIGTKVDSLKAEYWLKEYGKSLGLSVVAPTIDTVRIIDSSKVIPVIIPPVARKSILSNKFYSFLAYTYSLFEPAGVTIGFYDKFGFYLSYRTDLNSGNYDYTCNNRKVPEIGIENPSYEFARERWKCNMSVGGVFFPVFDRKFFLSVGGGYSERNYFREIVSLSDQSFGKNGQSSAWCLNTEASYKGWAAEIGGMWKWKKLIIFGGINSTMFRDLDGFLSLGYSF